MTCTCDYSYICPGCQDRIDIVNNRRIAEEWQTWTRESIKLIAEKLGVKLPEEPS